MKSCHNAAMRKLVVLLAFTTVLFAGSSLYLWNERVAARLPDGSPGVAVASAAPPAYEQLSPAQQDAARATGPAVSTPPAQNALSPPAPAPSSLTGDPGRERMRPFARDFLRQYGDSAQRAALLSNARAGLEAQYARLHSQLKLDAATFKQLIALLAEDSVDQQAGYFRCVMDPNCDPSRFSQPRDHTDEYLALLGADQYARFTDYRSTLSDWQSVVELRGRLSESNYLRDDAAERLLAELSAEHRQFVAQSGQMGASVRGWGDGNGFLWYLGDGTVEQQLASATQYSQALRSRAAAVLSAEQLRAFGQLQEEMLAHFASYLQQSVTDPD